MGYNLLEIERIPMPQVLKGKSRWVTCAAFAAATMALIASAVSVGVIMGYTYCYLEHRSGLKPGNLSESTSVHIVHMAAPESPKGAGNRTLQEALTPSIIISKILNLGQSLLEQELGHVNWPSET